MRPSATRGLLALLSATAFGCGQTQTDGTLQELTIARGATLAAVAETLETRGLVRSADLFAFYARMSGRRRAIQAGTYDVPAGATTPGSVRSRISSATSPSRWPSRSRCSPAPSRACSTWDAGKGGGNPF